MRETALLKRFGVSMEEELLIEFDKLIQRKGYATRSEALRDLARGALAEEVLADESAEAVATVSLVYNHHVPNLSGKLTEAQHKALDLIASTLHVHLDEDQCLETLILRGPYGRVRDLADKLISVKGVKYGKFVTTTGTSKPGKHHVHSHEHSDKPHSHKRDKPAGRARYP